MKIRSRIDTRYALAIAAIVFAAFAGGWYGSRFVALAEAHKSAAEPVRYNDPAYAFISPLVSVAIPNATGFPELAATKRKVSSIIDAAKARGVEGVGVYFRIPGNAHWFGIGENDKYDPGSLIKVPIMLAVLKEAEANPKMLERTLAYNSNLVDDIPDALPAQLPSGRYSVEKLLETMIVNSDNIAKEVLYNSAGIAAIQDVFDEMNANFLKDPSGTISPKSYVIILSRIYSATYLNRFYSNYAMNLLTQTTFRDGLVAGVPESVHVAHKYGESGIYEDKVLTTVELHDCGLVYAETPYYLCVMTKGKQTAVLAQLIQDISRAVYDDRDRFKMAQ